LDMAAAAAGVGVGVGVEWHVGKGAPGLWRILPEVVADVRHELAPACMFYEKECIRRQ
jgi:hypothetical protein